jgi:hypothetical protein
MIGEVGEMQPKRMYCIVEDQAFSPSSDLVPSPSPPSPPSRQQTVFLSLSSCVSPVELTDGSGGGGEGEGAKSYYDGKAWYSIIH